MKLNELAGYIRQAVRVVPQVLPYLNDRAVTFLKAGYDSIRGDYWVTVYDAIEGYLIGTRPITSFRNTMRRAMETAFRGAVNLGYEDAGGELPIDEDAQAWIDNEIGTERGNIGGLFTNLKKNWERMDAIHEANSRADGYAGKLDSIYTQAKMMGAGNPILTWALGETEVHCDTCLSLAGTKHRAKWYIKNNYIPRMPYASMSCGGHNCDCKLTDNNGNEYTLNG